MAICHLFTENSKQGFLMLVTKIQCPKNCKMEKKYDQLITKKKKQKKMPDSLRMKAWHLRVHFRWISRSMQAIHNEGRGRISQCQPHALICSIAEANNGTVPGVKSMRQITTVLLRCYRRYEYHVADFRLELNNLIIISSLPMRKNMRRRTGLWEF